MKSFLQHITEVFSSPYKWEWRRKDRRFAIATFRTSDDDYVEVSFAKAGPGKWDLVFDRNMSYIVNGKGDQFKIFATVMSVVKDFVETNEVSMLMFDAAKRDKNRARLYTRMALKYMPDGYHLHIKDSGNAMTFEITRDD